MKDFLTGVAERGIGLGGAITPRLPTVFTPSVDERQAAAFGANASIQDVLF